MHLPYLFYFLRPGPLALLEVFQVKGVDYSARIIAHFIKGEPKSYRIPLSGGRLQADEQWQCLLQHLYEKIGAAFPA